MIWPLIICHRNVIEDWPTPPGTNGDMATPSHDQEAAARAEGASGVRKSLTQHGCEVDDDEFNWPGYVAFFDEMGTGSMKLAWRRTMG